MASRQYIRLAESLPPRLSRFFARYPPAALRESAPASSVEEITQGVSTLSTSASTTSSLAPAAGTVDAVTSPSLNPFQPHRHPVTGRWQDPVFSLRRQAELVKLARRHGVEEFLPFTVKGTEERVRRRAENGLRMKGTGVGQKVKGKQSERNMTARLEKRRQAMIDMPRMIQQWKQRGHGRGWKKWPK